MLPRERFAWIWLIALVLVFAAYFTGIGAAYPAWLASSFLHKIGWLALALGSLGVIAFSAWLFTRDPKSVDERDRQIEMRASRIAYYVLMAGMIVVGCVMPFSHTGWDIVHAALRAIVIAEIVNAGLVVWWYRRGGWHG